MLSGSDSFSLSQLSCTKGVMIMKESVYQKLAGAEAFVVALSSLTYGLIFLFLVPATQKQLARTADSLRSFSVNPTGRQIASLMLALGGLAATAAIVGVYRRVRESNKD